MARKHRKSDQRYIAKPDTPHSLQQMRGPLLDRSRSLARRSVTDPYQAMRAIRNLMTEDLRREKRHLDANLPFQVYRRSDGGQAHVIGREVDTPVMRRKGLPSRLRYEFQDPNRTLVCVRRKVRRSVIFAMRKSGKGGKRNRRARWTDKSYISCRKGR